MRPLSLSLWFDKLTMSGPLIPSLSRDKLTTSATKPPLPLNGGG